MPHADVGDTRSSQLRAIRDWRDELAWLEFQKRYEPLLRGCCNRLRLDQDVADEVCQETWIEVAKRMRSFVYDPRGTFRGWLSVVCHHKAMDFLERMRNEREFSLDERDEFVRLAQGPPDLGDQVEETAEGILADTREGNTALAGLFREAEEIQAVVRQHVEPHTWEAFWLVAVMLWSVDRTARTLQMSHASVSKAKARVIKRLQAEGHRRALLGTEAR
jgi:RNA polymerase sigma factor (sigma-70 family)